VSSRNWESKIQNRQVKRIAALRRVIAARPANGLCGGEAQIFSRVATSAHVFCVEEFMAADARGRLPGNEYQSSAGSSAFGFSAFLAATESFRIHQC
jgi:hypothetical protein